MTNVNPTPPFGFVQPWFPGVHPLYSMADGLNPNRIAEDGAWFGGWVAAKKFVSRGNRTYAYLGLAAYRWARVWYDDARPFPLGPQLVFLGLLSGTLFFNYKLLPTFLLVDLFAVNV